MTCEIMGVRRVDMDNEKIHGWSVYVTHEEDGVDGLMAERFFISDMMLARDVGGVVPEPGQNLKFNWGRSKGKIGDIISID